MYDGLGSVTRITDGSGTPTEQITLDALGRTQNVGGTSSDPYQYKSEYGYRTDGDGNAEKIFREMRMECRHKIGRV